jgi:hypothetical protein
MSKQENTEKEHVGELKILQGERARFIEKYNIDPSEPSEHIDALLAPIQILEIFKKGVSMSKNRKGIKQAVNRLEEIAQLMVNGWPSKESFEENSVKIWEEAWIIANKYGALPKGFTLTPAKKVGVIRMGKGLNDHLLKRQGNRQPTLFEELENEWQDVISKTEGGAEVRTGGGIIAGVELEPEENALIDALYVMLHYKSVNTVEPKNEDYYTGGYEMAGRAALDFTATELARIYNGGKKASGDEMARLKEVIERLAGKRFMIEYKEERTPKGKKTVYERSVKAYAPLFEIREEKITKDGKSATSSFIVLHELFRASIASRYIELPEDIRARMQTAFGKASYTDYQLRNYLLNEVSNKRKEATINRETAYERFTRPNTRPARQRELLNKAMEGCKRLGILLNYEETTGKGGQLKLIMNPALEWSRNPMPLLEKGE